MATGSSRVVLEIVGDSSKLEREFGKAARSARVFNARMTGTFRGLSRGLGFAAATAGVASIGLAIRSTVQSAIDFEDSFAGVRKTVDATEPELRALAQGFRDMSREIPVSVDELNRIGEAAGQLGIRKAAIIDFTRTVADLGVTTDLSSEDAANALARLSNITGLPQDQFDRLGATLVDLGNKLAATESEIAEMSLRLAGAGNQIGLTEAQILGLSGALASVGVRAEAGGSAFSRVFSTMANDVASGGKSLQAFATIAGSTSADFRRQFERDAAGAVIQFIEGLARIKREGGNVFAVLEKVGLADIRVRDSLLRAAGAGDLFRRSLEIGTRAFRENNALTEEAGKRYATTASRLRIFQNRINDLKISLGDALIPALEGVVEPLSEWLDKTENQRLVTERLNNILRDAREVIQGVRDVVVPLAQGVRDLTERMGGLRQAVQLLIAAMVVGKVVSFAGAITGLSGASLAAAGRVNALRFALLRLGAIGVITLGVEIILNREKIDEKVTDFLRDKGLGFLTGKQIQIPKDTTSADLLKLRKRVADIKGEGDLLVKALDKAIAKLQKVEDKARQADAAASKRPEDQGGPRGPGAIAVSNATVEAKNKAERTKKEAAELRSAQEDATKAVENARKAAERAAEKQRAAFDALLDSFDLQLEKAATTRSFDDDLRILREKEKAVREQVRIEGRTTELERRLFEIQRERADIRRQQRELQASERQARQFRALGLTSTGEEKIPGVAQLRKQLGSLDSAIEGTFLDTKKTDSLLARIRRVLSGGLGKVSKEVRDKIRQMLADLQSELESGERKTGNITKQRILDPRKLLQGIGLSPEEMAELRRRIISGRVGGSGKTGAFGQVVPIGAGGTGGININGPVTVKADNPDAFMRELQKRARKSASSRRGRHGGKNLGLG